MIAGVVVAGFQGLTVDYPVTSVAVGAQKMGPIWPVSYCR